MKGFVNANVYVEGQGIKKTNLGFTDDTIEYIGLGKIRIDTIAQLDEDDIIVPGFIDEHIHGAAGFDAMDGTSEAISGIANALVKEGTTGFLATTMTQSPANITKALENVRDYMKVHHADGAEVLGVHLEGPFISPDHVGAQPLEYVAENKVEVFKGYQDASGNNIREITLAPEKEGSEEFIKYLHDNHIVASIGHTGATYNDVDKAIAAGATCVTHTYNAQRPIHHREIGTVGSALLRDELNCELICDTIHVSVPAIKLVVKNKPHDKLTLITDAMRAKSMPDGKSELGGQVVIVKNGEARLENGTLAGSVLKMNNAIKNVVTKCGVPFTDAIDFATINPAKNLGIADKYGSIAEGKKANLTVLDKNFEVVMTIRDGEIVYKR